MPLDLGNVKDVWQYAEGLKQSYSDRDSLLRSVLEHLQPRRTVYNEWTQKSAASVEYDAAFGLLQAQVRMATPRVALPFDLSLPEVVDITAAQSKLLENTERMMEGFFAEAMARRPRAQHHPEMWDVASHLVLRGAAVVWPKFILESGKHRPHFEVYDPGDVYMASGESGPQCVLVCRTLTLTQLRSFLYANGVESGPSGQPADQWQAWLVWALQGSEVWWGLMAQPSGSGSQYSPQQSQQEARWLLPPTYAPIYGDRIPLLYVGVDGPAARYGPVQQSAARGNSGSLPMGLSNLHYGRPFIADMMVHADTINLLRRTQMAGALMAATPAIIFQSQADDTVQVAPGQVTKITPNEQVEFLQAGTAYMQALEEQIQDEMAIIFQLGLNPLTVGVPAVRSELLRAGTQQASEVVLEPQRAGYKVIVEGMADNWRNQVYWLLTEGGLTEFQVVVPPRDDTRSRSGMRTYTEEQLYWDGRFEAQLSPLPEAEMVVRNAQIYTILSNTPNSGLSDAFLMSDTLGIRYPQKMRDQKRKEVLQKMLEPVALQVKLDDWSDQLMGLLAQHRPPLGDGAELVTLTRRNQDLISEVLGTIDLSGVALEEGRIKLRDLETIEAGVRAAANQFRQQLAAKAESKGASPAPGAGVLPAAAASQGSPASNGFGGNGNAQDEMAGMLRAHSGSDQGGMPQGA